MYRVIQLAVRYYIIPYVTSTENAGRFTSQIKNLFRQIGCASEVIADIVSVSVKCRRSATHEVFLLFMVAVRFGVYVGLHVSIVLRNRGSLYHFRCMYYISNSCMYAVLKYIQYFGRQIC